jgi:ABC-2 type transport system permease protein
MNATIASITTRGLLGRRRFLLLIPPPLVLLGCAFLGKADGDPVSEWGPPIIQGLGLAAVLPVIALIVGTGVLDSEIDDGTLLHVLAKPLPRYEILLTKLAVAAGVTAAVVAPPLFVAGLLAESAAVGLALAVAAAVGGIAYCAVFVAMSLLTRRPVLVGLVYVVLWEGALTNIVRGTRSLSIQQYVVSIAHRLAPTDALVPDVSITVALVMTSVFTVGFTWLAVRRLQVFSVVGETG